MPEFELLPLPTRQQKYNDFLVELKQLLPKATQVITDTKKLSGSYSIDKSLHLPHPPTAVALPSSIEEVAAVVKLCAKHGVPMTPRGAGTGLEGAAIPYHGGIVVDTSNLLRLDIDPPNSCAWVGAGVRKLTLLKKAAEHGLLFGPDPSSNPSVGGMVSTAGSGMSTLKYGTSRENVLALRVVTPQGEIIQTRQVVRKSSAGLELTQLYCGSEGTLGVICEIAVRLFPVLKYSAGGVATFKSTHDAMKAIFALKHSGPPPTLLRCEFLNKEGVKASNSYSKLKLEPAATVLLEFTDSDSSLRAIRKDFKTVEKVFKAAGNATKVRFLRVGKEMDSVWEARRACLFAAMHSRGKLEKVLTTDVCLPLSNLEKAITSTEDDFDREGVPCLICAHIADGNFHLNIPYDTKEELATLKALEGRMIDRTIKLGGTVSGEHGVGVGKVKYLTAEHGVEQIKVQETIKQALDPQNIMNPGVFYPTQQLLYPTAHL